MSRTLERAPQLAEVSRTASSHHSAASSGPISPADINANSTSSSPSELHNQSDPFTMPSFGLATDVRAQQRRGFLAVSTAMAPGPNNVANSDLSMGRFDGQYGQEPMNRREAGIEMSEHDSRLLPNYAAMGGDACADLEAQLLNPVPPYLTQWLPPASVPQSHSWMPWS